MRPGSVAVGGIEARTRRRCNTHFGWLLGLLCFCPVDALRLPVAFLASRLRPNHTPRVLSTFDQTWVGCGQRRIFVLTDSTCANLALLPAVAPLVECLHVRASVYVRPCHRVLLLPSLSLVHVSAL